MRVLDIGLLQLIRKMSCASNYINVTSNLESMMCSEPLQTYNEIDISAVYWYIPFVHRATCSTQSITWSCVPADSCNPENCM